MRELTMVLQEFRIQRRVLESGKHMEGVQLPAKSRYG